MRQPHASTVVLNPSAPTHTAPRPRVQNRVLRGGDISVASLRFARDEPLSSFPFRPWNDGASARRHRHFLAGRWCAQQALAHVGHHDHCELVADAHGLPQWPNTWLGSISHTEGQAVAAVAPAECFIALGVDVERLLKPDRAARLQPRIADGEELELLPDLELARSVTLIFSAKEALYKALYPHTRQFMGFDAARLYQRRNDVLTFALTRDWNAAWRRGHGIDVHFRLGSHHVHSIVGLQRH